jgi:deoxyguanosine kinase
VNQRVFLAIEGPIGAGKTTLAHLVHQTWRTDLLLEHFDANPFLPLFYADRQRYAWPTQLHFLVDRFDQMTELPLTSQVLVSDYLFDKDRLFAELTLDDPMLHRYRKVFAALRGAVPQPTGVIFLQADVDVLMTRIAARARPYEQGMERAYLSLLRQAYEDFFASYTEAPVLRIDTTQQDFSPHGRDRAAVVSMIQSTFALPMP